MTDHVFVPGQIVRTVQEIWDDQWAFDRPEDPMTVFHVMPDVIATVVSLHDDRWSDGQKNDGRGGMVLVLVDGRLGWMMLRALSGTVT